MMGFGTERSIDSPPSSFADLNDPRVDLLLEMNRHREGVLDIGYSTDDPRHIDRALLSLGFATQTVSTDGGYLQTIFGISAQPLQLLVPKVEPPLYAPTPFGSVAFRAVANATRRLLPVSELTAR